MPDDAWLNERIDDLALEMGKLKRSARYLPLPDREREVLEYRVERICNRIWTLLAHARLTAGDRVNAGMEVEQALKETEAETRQMNWMLGLDSQVLPRL